jgi:hypothetical protein
MPGVLGRCGGGTDGVFTWGRWGPLGEEGITGVDGRPQPLDEPAGATGWLGAEGCTKPLTFGGATGWVGAEGCT